MDLKRDSVCIHTSHRGSYLVGRSEWSTRCLVKISSTFRVLLFHGAKLLYNVMHTSDTGNLGG